MAATRSTPTTNSGIRQLGNGESVIPASKRADGSVRREIRVKPGYKPPEDVEVYRNRTAEGWRNRGKGGIPGAQLVKTDEREASQQAAAAKRRDARKRAAAAAASAAETSNTTTGVAEEPLANFNTDKPEKHLSAKGDAAADKEREIDPEAEKTKEARKLQKKLRQARDLQEKKDKGDSLLPEQVAKVIKINELIRQLETLGFGAESEAKVDKDATAD